MTLRRLFMTSLFCLLPAVAQAQTAQLAQAAPPPENQPASLRDQLMPTAEALKLLQAPAVSEASAARLSAGPQAYHGSGTGYMIAGAALFVAGLLVDGDAGTVLILAGAGIGAYGLYLHFR